MVYYSIVGSSRCLRIAAFLTKPPRAFAVKCCELGDMSRFQIPGIAKVKDAIHLLT
jgi:hypothetical protein